MVEGQEESSERGQETARGVGKHEEEDDEEVRSGGGGRLAERKSRMRNVSETGNEPKGNIGYIAV